MELRHFEQRIKTLFGSHRPETDTDAIWKNIEPHLKKRKKRRSFFWLFALALLTFSGLFVSRDYSAVSRPVEPAAAEYVPNKAGVKPAFRQVFSDKPPVKPAPLQHPEPKAAYKPTGNYLSANLPAPGMAPEFVKPAPAGPVAAKNPAFENDQDKPVPPFLPVIWNGQVTSLDSVPKSRVLPVQEPGEEEKERLFALADPNDPSNKRRKKHRKLRLRHEINVSAGPALGISLMGKGEATTEHLTGRKATEHVLESYTAGMFYSVATRKGFVLKTGLQYRQINEKFHLDYTRQEIEYVHGVLTQTEDAEGNVISQTTGNKRVIKTTIYSNTAFNHYYFLNVPIGIGYRMADRRTRREFSGGLDANLFFRANATLYNAVNEPTAYKHGLSGYEKMFRSRAGWGIWGAYAYEWKMSHRWNWQLSGSVQIPFHPISNTDYTVAQRHINVGAQVGGIYHLSKPKKSKNGTVAAKTF